MIKTDIFFNFHMKKVFFKNEKRAFLIDSYIISPFRKSIKLLYFVIFNENTMGIINISIIKDKKLVKVKLMQLSYKFEK